MSGLRWWASGAMFLACLMPIRADRAAAQDAPASATAVIEALQKGQYDEALRMNGELLRAEPQSHKLWTLQGVAQERSGHPREALESYHHAVALSPDYLPALEGAAQLEYKAESAKALPLLHRIVTLQPDEPTAHAMLGVLEYRDKRYEAAAADFAVAGDILDARPEALMAYAQSLHHLNRGAEAIPQLQKLVQLQPDDRTACYDLALLQWRYATSTDALATLQPLIDGGKADARTLRLAAAIHEEGNETPQAVQLLRSAILAAPDEPASYLDFATLAFQHGSYSVGIDIVSAGLSQLPRSAALYMARGVLYGQNGDFDKAMSDFQQAHKLDPNFSMSATAEGIAQSQQHHNTAAIESFRRQVREHPKDGFGYYLLAEALSWTPPDAQPGDHARSVAEAISAATSAVKLDPQLVQAYDLLGSLYLQNGQTEPAIHACRTALKLNPKDQQALYSLILALRKTGSKEELKLLVEQLTSLRKEEQAANKNSAHYGTLIERP